MRVLMKLIAFHIGDKQGVRKMKVSELSGWVLAFPGGSDGKESACNAGDLI